jgi:hypothetical protein
MVIVGATLVVFTMARANWFMMTRAPTGAAAGDFNTTKFAKLGDKGSVVLPYRPTGTVWKRGGVGKPTWFVRANHGGGYSYRLCKSVVTLRARGAAFIRDCLAFLYHIKYHLHRHALCVYFVSFRSLPHLRSVG